jgi:hypothetical protein
MTPWMQFAATSFDVATVRPPGHLFAITVPFR